MSKKNTTAKEPKQKIEFSILAPDAESVQVSGDFNNWDPGKDSLKKTPMGVWQKDLMLSPGTYEYKFIVDGQWIEEPKDKSCLNVFGTYNNLLQVSK